MGKKNKWVTIKAIEGSIIFTPKEIKTLKNSGINLIALLQETQKKLYKK